MVNNVTVTKRPLEKNETSRDRNNKYASHLIAYTCIIIVLLLIAYLLQHKYFTHKQKPNTKRENSPFKLKTKRRMSKRKRERSMVLYYNSSSSGSAAISKELNTQRERDTTDTHRETDFISRANLSSLFLNAHIHKEKHKRREGE